MRNFEFILLSKIAISFQLEALLSLKKKMTVRDIKTFLPFSINLDPYIKKVIKDEYQIHEEVLNNNGHTGPLTQRQAAGLSRKLSSDPSSKNVSMVGMAQSPVAPTYQNFAMHHMAPWPQFQPPSGYGFDSRGGSPPGFRIKTILSKISALNFAS